MAFDALSWLGPMEWFHLLRSGGWLIKMPRLSCLIGMAPSLLPQDQFVPPMLAFDARKPSLNNPVSLYGSPES
jgi:hypothetical protein